MPSPWSARARIQRLRYSHKLTSRRAKPGKRRRRAHPPPPTSHLREPIDKSSGNADHAVVVTHNNPTHPPTIDSIAATLREQWRRSLREDEHGSEVSDLLSAEERIVAFCQQMALGMVQDFVNVRQEQARAQGLHCACGEPLVVHQNTVWQRKTLVGVVEVTDPYLYCRTCKMSGRPLHELLGTTRETWSLVVEEAAVDLVTDESCGKAVKKLARHHHGVEMERTSALRMLHKHGKRARGFIDMKLAQAYVQLERPKGCQPEGFKPAQELEVEFDGGMIPVATLEPIVVPEGEQPERTPVRGLLKRKKVARWEEAKAGLVQVPGETERLYILRPTGDLDLAYQDLFACAVLQGWTQQTQMRGIADGAIHIRTRLAATFAAGSFQFILDRPHAKEHLSAAGEALAPITGEPAQQWARGALARLEHGDVGCVVDELFDHWFDANWEASSAEEKTRIDRLRLEANYFDRNQESVAYAYYRDRGWSTASSEIESAHRHLVQCRLKIAGAWWHPDHVDDILALRMLRANGWWDAYWRDQRAGWKERACQLATPAQQSPQAA